MELRSILAWGAFVKKMFLAAVCLSLVGGLSPGAGADTRTYPGRNGKILLAGGGDLYLIQPDGSGRTLLCCDAGHPQNVPLLMERPEGGNAGVFSPDGRWVAFISGTEAGPSIYAMRVDGTDLRRVTEPAGDDDGDYDIAWSPDSRRLAFMRWTSKPYERQWVFTVDRDGSNLRQLTDESEWAAHPQWVDDGRIAFDGAGGVWLIRLADSYRRRLNDPDDHEVYSFDITADARWLVYDHYNQNTMSGPGGGGISRIRLDGTRHERLASWRGQNDLHVDIPSPSPDGETIAYRACWNGLRGPCSTRLMDADGSNKRVLVRDVNYPGFWSPNSKKIVFAVRTDRNHLRYSAAVNVGTREVRRLADPQWGSPSAWKRRARS